MNSQQLLIINFIIFAGLILLFFFGRSKPKQYLNLELKKITPDAEKAGYEQKQNKAELTQDDLKTDLRDVSVVGPSEQMKSSILGDSVIERDSEKLKETALKSEIVYFVYNGHEWEAHEVLGVASGKSLEEITNHYQHLIKTSDPSTFEFYEAAYSAVLKLKSPKW